MSTLVADNRFSVVISPPETPVMGVKRPQSVSVVALEVLPQAISEWLADPKQVRHKRTPQKIDVEVSPIDGAQCRGLIDWYKKLSDSAEPLKRGVLEVRQVDRSGWRLKGVWPCRWRVGGLSAEGPSREPSIEFSFAYDEIELIDGKRERVPRGYTSDAHAGATQSKASSNQVLQEVIRRLKETGLEDERIHEIVRAMELDSISIETAGPDCYGVRWYGGKANRKSRWIAKRVFDGRKEVAVRPKWGNLMNKVEVQQIKPGTEYVLSRASAQGAGYEGGAWQMMLFDPRKDLL